MTEPPDAFAQPQHPAAHALEADLQRAGSGAAAPLAQLLTALDARQRTRQPAAPQPAEPARPDPRQPASPGTRAYFLAQCRSAIKESP